MEDCLARILQIEDWDMANLNIPEALKKKGSEKHFKAFAIKRLERNWGHGKIGIALQLYQFVTNNIAFCTGSLWLTANLSPKNWSFDPANNHFATQLGVVLGQTSSKNNF